MPVSKRKGKRRKEIEARKKKQRQLLEGQLTAKGRKRFIKEQAKDFRRFYQENMHKAASYDEFNLPNELDAESYANWRKENISVSEASNEASEASNEVLTNVTDSEE